MKKESNDRRFKVAFSFPGELRRYVRRVDGLLSKHFAQKEIFFDERFECELAGLDSDIRLQNIYRKHSFLIVLFLCREYVEKNWCSLEWAAIRDVMNQRGADVLLLRFDSADLPGIFSNTITVNAEKKSPGAVAKLIFQRYELAAAGLQQPTLNEKPEDTVNDAVKNDPRKCAEDEDTGSQANTDPSPTLTIHLCGAGAPRLERVTYVDPRLAVSSDAALATSNEPNYDKGAIIAWSESTLAIVRLFLRSAARTRIPDNTRRQRMPVLELTDQYPGTSQIATSWRKDKQLLGLLGYENDDDRLPIVFRVLKQVKGPELESRFSLRMNQDELQPDQIRVLINGSVENDPDVIEELANQLSNAHDEDGPSSSLENCLARVAASDTSLAIGTDRMEFELRIKKPLSSFTDAEKRRFLVLVKQVLEIEDDPDILIREGSIILTIRNLRPDQAERLKWAFEGGGIDDEFFKDSEVTLRDSRGTSEPLNRSEDTERRDARGNDRPSDVLKSHSTTGSSVCDEVRSALQASPLVDLRELWVEVDGPDCLVIRGMVGSFYHKQLAQEAVRAVVKKLDYKVVNHVEVIDALTN